MLSNLKTSCRSLLPRLAVLMMAALSLIATAPASAQALNSSQTLVLNNLSTASGAIKSQLSLGTSYVAGFTAASSNGTIVDPNAYQTATITDAQRTSYNSAMTAFTNTNYSVASQLFLNTAKANIASMQKSITDLAAASVDLQKAVTVNQMLSSITDAPSARSTQQAIITAGLSTEITGRQLDAYNTSLASVNSYASQAAAFFRAADSVQLTTNVDNFAKQYNKDLAYASADFSYATGTLSVSFADGLGIAQSGALNAYKQSSEAFYSAMTGSQ